MEAIYHELAAGKDSGLSQVLAEWRKQYEKQYETLCLRFPSFLNDINGHQVNVRPKSAELRQPTFTDVRSQFDEVLKLRATLTVEVDALQQLRAELEDTQSMSEVHMQLERATMENRRLQSALRVAHEQISDLYFNKRVLEAEMTALRSDRDQQVAEANERIRMAERAVVAATSRRRLTDPVAVPSAVQSSPARGANANQTDAEESITTGCLLSRVQPTYTTFRPVDRKSRDVNRFKQYATLTAMNYDDFDSLDEDENVVDSDATADETAAVELQEPHAASDKPQIQPILQSSVDIDGSIEANRNELSVPLVNDLPPPQLDSTEEAAGDRGTPSRIGAVDTGRSSYFSPFQFDKCIWWNKHWACYHLKNSHEIRTFKEV
ncbi:hypothetical protein EG68_12205 [Paragonimus skrjabini miyazakii]|uniref:Uncharacterized protein n=1 Tax=Paragonimus skrjabini miyazakii TaxID=59628 RepID=A0A8S9YDT2_9TREM|nr:hypothetical protein EG68_12205 [Paragonimus skrjabini miyazakii]